MKKTTTLEIRHENSNTLSLQRLIDQLQTMRVDGAPENAKVSWNQVHPTEPATLVVQWTEDWK